MSDTSLTIENILAPELTLCRVAASSKKRALEFIAEQINHQDNTLSETQLFNNLISRERLGSTGIGQGIAIPHCRLEGLDHVVGVRGECSSTAIRAMIKKLIAAETPKKPLSDSKIAAMLGEQGIKVARRTVAKYREAMHIPPSNERKRLV